MDIRKPRDARDVAAAVREALDAGQPLEIVGHGSKRAVGHRMATNAVLDLSALDAVTLYEPNELVLTVEAGASLAEVEALIDRANQQFAFEPMDTSVLLGTPSARGTVGGMIAAGLAGPRRIKAGGARDHLLGLHAVSGFGESFKTGGRVVKNVTGYDLCKLVAGSWGTLAVMTEVTLKVLPKAEATRTLVLRGLDDAAAVRAMSMALGSAFDVSGAAHLPASISRLTGALAGFGAGEGAVTLLRLEGFPASVAHRGQSLAAALRPAFGAAEFFDDAASATGWSAVRDVAPFAAGGPLGAWPVWRIVCPPASGGEVGQALARATGGEVIYDWGGGLIWAALPPAQDAHAVLLRTQLAPTGGHATLIRAIDAVRDGVAVFPPLEAGLAALGARVKSAFDPSDLFNRGRLARGAA